MTEPEFVKVFLENDYYLGPYYSEPGNDDYSAGPLVSVLKDQFARWQQAFEDYRDAQDEIRGLYNSAMAQKRAEREKTQWSPSSPYSWAAVTSPRSESRCYRSSSGYTVHVKPGCTCP